jgi:uncharacterized DUF497 family protein
VRDDEFEWDDKKAKRNVREHGVTFEVARRAFKDPLLIERLDPDEPEEDRILLTGLAGDVLLTICYVERGHRIRIISARKATQREQDEYNDANA